MERQMSATQARVNFGEVLRYVTDPQQVVIVNHAGKPHAAIISIAEYERCKIQEPQPDWRMALIKIRQLRKKISARRGGRLLSDPTEILHQVREERDAQLAAAVDLH